MKQQIIEKKLDRSILLNPGPATTSERVKSALLVSDICPREESFAYVLKEVLELATAVVVPPEARDRYQCVLTGSSGTGAIECVLSSVVALDESVLILDNGAYGARMAEIATSYQIRHEVIKTTWGDPLDYEQIEQFLSKRARDFKYLAFIHHETTSGILNDLPRLQALAQKYQLKTIVDAMSSYAGVEINLARTPVHYLISSSNKCIQGMAGLGIIIADKTSLLNLEHQRSRSFYFNLFKNYKSQTHGGQFLFTPPVQIVYALAEALREFFDEGAQNRVQRYSDLYEQMLAGMTELGFKTLNESEHHSRILTAFIEPTHVNYHFDQMHDFLLERGITIYPGKGARESSFRISNIGQLDASDIEYFLHEMKAYLTAKQIELRC